MPATHSGACDARKAFNDVKIRARGEMCAVAWAGDVRVRFHTRGLMQRSVFGQCEPDVFKRK
jgi:hypothetical protein